MIKKLLLELPNHNIFYIKTNTINYYIAIPKHFDTTNICIEIKNKMGNFDMELNDEIWVLENIKNTYSYIDNYNITLVIPVLKDEHVSILEKIDTNQYEDIDKLLGFTINNAYNLLKENNIKTSNEVILVNNEKYKIFINWFLVKYKNRVVCKNLLELVQLFNANATTYKKLETPVMSFVVGSYNAEVEAPRIEHIPEERENTTLNKTPQVSYGYATSWILAAVTIVISILVAVVAIIWK